MTKKNIYNEYLANNQFKDEVNSYLNFFLYKNICCSVQDNRRNVQRRTHLTTCISNK